YFWTGRMHPCNGEEDSVKPFAEKIAGERGGFTLETRLSGAGVTMPPFGSSPQAKEAWRFAAGTYASDTKDQAWVLKGDCTRDANTWDRIELPALQKGGQVNCIWQLPPPNWNPPSLLWAAPGQESYCSGMATSSSATQTPTSTNGGGGV